MKLQVLILAILLTWMPVATEAATDIPTNEPQLILEDCIKDPLPTEPNIPNYSFSIHAADGSIRANIIVWREACLADPSLGIELIRIQPGANKTPSICGSDFSLIHDKIHYDNIISLKQTINPASYFCGELLTPATFVFTYSSPHFLSDDAFTLLIYDDFIKDDIATEIPAYELYAAELESPTGVEATDGTYSDRVRITFNPVAGTSLYRVYRCLDDGPTCGAPIGYPHSGSFDDTGGIVGKVYHYRVSACTMNTCSLLSAADTGYRQSAGGFMVDGVIVGDTSAIKYITSHYKRQIIKIFTDGSAHFRRIDESVDEPGEILQQLVVDDVVIGSSDLLTWFLINPNKNKIRFVTNGNLEISVDPPVGSPQITLFKANAATITAGDEVTLTWNSTDNDYCEAAGDFILGGSLASSGTETFIENSPGVRSYQLNCYAKLDLVTFEAMSIVSVFVEAN